MTKKTQNVAVLFIISFDNGCGSLIHHVAAGIYRPMHVFSTNQLFTYKNCLTVSQEFLSYYVVTVKDNQQNAESHQEEAQDQQQ